MANTEEAERREVKPASGKPAKAKPGISGKPSGKSGNAKKASPRGQAGAKHTSGKPSAGIKSKLSAGVKSKLAVRKKPDAAKKRSRVPVESVVIVCVSLAILAGVVMISTFSSLAPVRGAIGSVLSPVQGALNSVGVWMQDKVNLIFNQSELERENAELKQELSSIYVRIARYDEVVSENERLTTLLGAAQGYIEYEPVFARVTGKDTGNWFQTFTIDRGIADGVVKDMPVMSADGLVGRVTEAGKNYAKVTSIIDGSGGGVAALIERNRDEGIVRGVIDTTDEELYMYYLPDVNAVTPGDAVVTSGHDSSYPKGLPIGEVTQISRQASGLSQYVVVTPYTDFKHIEEVLVLTAATPETKAAAAQALQELIQSGVIATPTVAPAPTPTIDPYAALPTPVPSGDWYVQGEDDIGAQNGAGGTAGNTTGNAGDTPLSLPTPEPTADNAGGE